MTCPVLLEEAGRKSRVIDETKPMLVVDSALPIEKYDRTLFYNIALSETSDIIKRVSVTLDVETAHAGLEVSEDRKRVRRTWTERSLPDTGKRFTDSRCVLGSEGFTSGRHYWEVEVAGNQWWCLGVAVESVDRKGGVELTPETGVWSIGRDDAGAANKVADSAAHPLVVVGSPATSRQQHELSALEPRRITYVAALGSVGPSKG
ncbi:E3 ubiquitin-protein ligase TRIM39-like [Amblyraja radiata]|uniref:E3 ubiquitin-protein ligase TRIM39-like n=1 Tax=Amblyraja radiata TaxID=386614 RepID=UPI001402DC43|nr:E3 ubiquitin-protein ligase TRIM39-like [Amblyraja radiata]